MASSSSGEEKVTLESGSVSSLTKYVRSNVVTS